MKLSDSGSIEKEALSFFNDKGDIKFTVHEVEVEDVIDINIVETRLLLNDNINHEQYLQLLKIRQIVSALVLALTIFWVLRIVLKDLISFKEDSVRVVLISFIGMLIPVMIATRIYDFLYFNDREQNQE
jgi:hypothetical protein